MINTELTVTVTDANGTTKTLDSQAASAADRPRGIQFSTQIQSGFYTASFNLRRAIDRDNDDLHLGDDVKITLANGDTVYEGFVTALPRSTDGQTHTLSVSCAGWMAHASDEPFTQVFVDRDLSQWHGAGSARRAGLLSSTFGTVNDPTAMTDLGGRAALHAAIAGPWTVGKYPISEAWVDAGPGNAIGLITAGWTKGPNTNAADPNWTWVVALSADDVLSSIDSTPTLRAAGPGVTALSATTGSRRFGVLQFYYSTAAVAAADTEYNIDWDTLAIYGYGVPLVGTSAPYGVAASDVITYLANRYAPMLDTSGVKQTTWPISQLAFREPTKAYDAFLKVNSYHLWKLGVWEKRKLCYSPIDLTDWDWEIRHDEVGNQIGLQGDELTNLRNGIIVQYTNAATGAVDRLYPADHVELQDTSIDNPYTAHGRRGYGDPFVIPFPTTTADALELGRVQLDEDNQPKAPGSFQVTGQIRDRAGNYQPVSKVRAGDRIRLTSSVNLSDRPRLIQETSYSHDGLSVTIAVDSTLRFLEGYFDRVQTAMAAANLAT